MAHGPTLPPGQLETDGFPRFGLTPFAHRFPAETRRIELRVQGDVERPFTVSEELLRELPRVEQASDLHCVTTWTRRALRWGGFRFSDVFERLVRPRARPLEGATFVVLRCQDGYRSCLPLADMLASDVLLADALEGAPLTIEHGAPLRLVAPAHYAYKSAKHVDRVELWCDESRFRPPLFRFLTHPRARVALEERGRGVPGWLLRRLYRPLVRPTAWIFRRAMRHAPTLERDAARRGDPAP